MKLDTWDQFQKHCKIPKIAVLTPTRNRPGKLLKCLSGFAATITHPDIAKIYIGVDEDDPSHDEIVGIVGQFRCAVRVDIPAMDGFPGLGWLWNRVAEKAMADGMDVFGMMGDDTISKTNGWDLMVANAYVSGPEDQILCVYVWEGNDKKGLNTSFPFVSRKYIELVGQYVPEYYPVDAIDTHLADVHRRIGRIESLSGILWDHIHWLKGRAEPDDTTLNRMNFHENKKESQRMWNASVHLREEEACKLQEYIDSFRKAKR